MLAQTIDTDWEDFGNTVDEEPTEVITGDSTGNALVVSQMPSFLQPDEMPDLDEMDEGPSIAPKYWEVETPGESKRGILIGWSKLNSQQGGTVPMAVFQNAEGVFTSAAVNLTQQVQVLPIGTPLSITYAGKEKTNNGYQVKKFDVRLLNVNGARPTIQKTQAPSRPTPDPRVSVGNIGKGIPPMPSKQNGGASKAAAVAASVLGVQRGVSNGGIVPDSGKADSAMTGLTSLLGAYEAQAVGKEFSEEHYKRWRQQIGIKASKTALKDEELRHLFVRSHFADTMEGNLTELSVPQLRAFSDWLARNDAKAYIAEWASNQ